MVVSERFWAPDMHFELGRNIDFCDKISSIFRCHGTGRLVANGVVHTQRGGVIPRQYQAMTYSNCLILTDFRIVRLQDHQRAEKTREIPLAHGPFVRPLSLSRYYSSVQPLYEPRSFLNKFSGRQTLHQTILQCFISKLTKPKPKSIWRNSSYEPKRANISRIFSSTKIS